MNQRENSSRTVFRRLCRMVALLAPMLLAASEAPYFVTYTHQMEEPENLEIAVNQVAGHPSGAHFFASELLEFEYGVKGWWTTEVYLAGQQTRGEGALFTGYKWENRFRPLLREHWINPVLYLEYSRGNAADKSLLEVVGNDSAGDLADPMDEARREREREIETKLILSSNFRGWNLSENLIAEKNLAHEPWEFGYSVATSRPLALAASPGNCRFCRENLDAGVEMYGGLGTWTGLGLRQTSHYIAPVLAWHIPGGPTLKASPSFGLNANSAEFLFRFGVAYEVNQFGRLFRHGE